ncbi:hypothetical protein BJ138DRAFT_1060539 [Hygrophoropsis aurantiaca]|uniref:Uncharacterized protein n=1 Tax=Hygrophoropsis aurantiaca TaxID=72124 RepID=A0ACB8AGM8_9AGAM|nr:hypothetical protein BJ138DRAFT_1060539 [Hygrophoropsis aurantiaca]
MVLKVLAAAVSAWLPSNYYVHILVAIGAVVVVHAFAQGRTTSRERDMHARVVLITGGFTPLGLTLIQSLAERGAHIIALSQKPIDDPEVDILVSLLRSTTKNDQIFAEECDLASPASVRSFCSRFLAGKDQRLDAILFAHEYQQIGYVSSFGGAGSAAKSRADSSLSTFLITTLLLPVLLVAPVERDIRLIHVVNPFYAASVPTFSPATPLTNTSLFHQEGWRSLQTAVFVRHLQRVLDALPTGGQVPKTDENTIHVVNEKVQKSNIVAVSVCPGVSRSDTIAPMLNAVRAPGRSMPGTVLYILLQPFLRLLTKSPISAAQSVLHVLFLPTPFKSTVKNANSVNSDVLPEEVLKAGALYRECAVVNLRVPLPPPPQVETSTNDDPKEPPLVDDGELGGVYLGQSIWESYETKLKEWEKSNPTPNEKVRSDDTSVDTDSG